MCRCLWCWNMKMSLSVSPSNLGLTHQEIDHVLDYLCAVAKRRQIFFLWRAVLRDPKDDFVLELAVEGGCEFIITYNQRDFSGIERFGLRTIDPPRFSPLDRGLTMSTLSLRLPESLHKQVRELARKRRHLDQSICRHGRGRENVGALDRGIPGSTSQPWKPRGVRSGHGQGQEPGPRAARSDLS